MNFLRTFGIAWKGLWSYPIRTLLAILGISISSLLVIFLLTVLHNFKISLVGQIQNVGLQQIVAIPGQLLNNDAMNADISSFLSFTSISSTLTYKDAEDVKQQVNGIEAVAPQIETITKISQPDHGIETIFTGITAGYMDIFRFNLAEGDFLTEQNLNDKELVVVLGHTVKNLLFGQQEALGEKVIIKGLEFTVIGVLEEKELLGFNFNERVYAPYHVVSDLSNLQNASMIFFKSATKDNMEQVEIDIHKVISSNHGTNDFNLLKPDEALHLINKIMDLVTAITVGITGVSFLVSGIGIMNVMLLTVKERTREIGIRKAVGAQSRHILLQFLFEATYISILGFTVGVGITYGLLQALHSYFPALSNELLLELVGISLGFSIALGLLFGIVPAIMALRVKPIDALRYE
jgi:putative ABC transport system permease protein